MGIFDFFTSTRRPAKDVPVLSSQQVREAILAINRPTAPFQIIEGTSEDIDLIAEWKIVDAQWYQLFAKAGLKEVFKILMRLDDASQEVRALDQSYSVSWQLGVPTLSLSVKAFRGQQQSIEFGTAYAYTETLRPGQVFNYRFNTAEIKKPIQAAITACGWTYRGVAFGKL